MSSSPFVRSAAALVLAASVAGCHAIPLYGNPFSDGPKDPPVSVYSIDWWKKLVEPRTFEVGPREFATPAIDPETGRVVALTRDGHVRALEADGTRVIWSLKTGHGFYAGATIHEGTVYVPGGDGVLYALDLKTGAEKWRYEAKEALATVPVIADGKLLVVSLSDTLFAINAADGKWAWQYRRDPPSGFTVRGAARPLVTFGTAYVGFSDGMFVAIAIDDGTVNWNRQLSAEEQQFVDVDTDPVVDDAGRLYVASYRDGLFALNPENGDLLWKATANGINHLLHRGEVVFTTGDDHVSAYLSETGKVLWTQSLRGRAAGKPTLVRGTLVVPVENELMFLDATTGSTTVAWDPGAGVSAPAQWVGSKLYVLSNNGVLYALRLVGSNG